MTLGVNSSKRSFSLASRFLMLIILLGSVPVLAQPLLLLEVGDVTAIPNQQQLEIPIYLTNFSDSVAAFNIYIKLGRPDIMEFPTAVDTIFDSTYWDCTAMNGPDCIDSTKVPSDGTWNIMHIDTVEISTGSVKTQGTITQNWEFVQARSLASSGTSSYDLNIVALANEPAYPFTPGFGPRNNRVLLVKLLLNVYDIPDEMVNRICNVLVETQSILNFGFSRPDGSRIDLTYETVLDTNYYICTQPNGETCMQWQEVSTPPYDSMSTQWIDVPVIDTARVFVDEGSVAVYTAGVCGDMNLDGHADIVDLTYIVEFLFGTGGPPVPYCGGDVTCDQPCTVDIVDLTFFVEYLFGGGPLPCQGPTCL